MKLDVPPTGIKRREYKYHPTALALSFFIPCLILLAVFKTLGFYPFGTRSLLVLDMLKQYSLFYESLWQIPSGDAGE